MKDQGGGVALNPDPMSGMKDEPDGSSRDWRQAPLSSNIFCTGRSRRAAGMLDFFPLARCLAAILTRNGRVLPDFFFRAAKAQMGAEFREITRLSHE